MYPMMIGEIFTPFKNVDNILKYTRALRCPFLLVEKD